LKRVVLSTALLDTSLESKNIGDEIIVKSILREFPSLATKRRMPTHSFLGGKSIFLALRSRSLFLTGTNILSSFPWPPSPWRFGPLELLALQNKVVPIGVGWRKYEGRISLLQLMIYKSIFKRGIPVSTRDAYSARKLQNAGIRAINTSCPTLWSLSDDLPKWGLEREVVTSVTDYRKDHARDNNLLDQLSSQFDKVLLWPQSHGDVEYANELDLPANVVRLNPDLAEFERMVEGRIYVGTRLHAGIRASQLGRPSLVVVVDNRAREICGDTNFPSVERNEICESLPKQLAALKEPRNISLPRDAIAEFKKVVNSLIT